MQGPCGGCHLWLLTRTCQSGDCDSDLLSSSSSRVGPHSEGDLSARPQPTHCQPAGQVSGVLSSDILRLNHQPVGYLIHGYGIKISCRRLPGE